MYSQILQLETGNSVQRSRVKNYIDRPQASILIHFKQNYILLGVLLNVHNFLNHTKTPKLPTLLIPFDTRYSGTVHCYVNVISWQDWRLALW